MPAINPMRQKWLGQLQEQLRSGKWGQVVETFFDEPFDPANDFPWEPTAIVKQNEGGRTIYVILAEKLDTDLYYHQWREWNRCNTYEDALREVVRLRPWGFR